MVDMMILVTKWFGAFVCDDHRIVDQRLFEKDPKKMAEKLSQIQRGEVLPEEEELAEKGIKVSDSRLSKLGKPVVFDSSFIKGENFSYSSELMHEVMMELGKIRTRESVRPDQCIVQAVRALDDLFEMINTMNERLKEWYGLHFPELLEHVNDRRYASLIAEMGDREEIIDELDLDIVSMGSELADEDIDLMRDGASQVLEMYKRKEDLEGYVARRMEEVAPNLTTLLGPNLGARLISLSGSLERLARMPSSTVQLLGAEKALFLHLKKNKKPPKHGIIFQHPSVHRAPYWQRGKIARTLANKASIASRVDYWEGDFVGEDMKEEFEQRVQEIKRKYPHP